MIQGGDFTKGDGESSIRVWTEGCGWMLIGMIQVPVASRSTVRSSRMRTSR